MKLKWLGHAAFLATSDDGKKVIIDPYESGSYDGAVGYGKISEEAAVVAVTHDHADHNGVSALPGAPALVKGAGEQTVKGLTFKGVATYHDETGGSQRGKNTAFVFEMDGLKICHLGDLGHILSDQEASEIGPVDVLLIPVGGLFTIDALTASEVVNQLNPKIVVPMHYKTERCGFPIAEVEPFLKGKESVRRMDESELEIRRDALPPQTEIVVLRHAL